MSNIQEIFARPFTKAQFQAAKALLESCPYTTTALAALAAAVRDLYEGSEEEACADILDSAVLAIATQEATEI